MRQGGIRPGCESMARRELRDVPGARRSRDICIPSPATSSAARRSPERSPAKAASSRRTLRSHGSFDRPPKFPYGRFHAGGEGRGGTPKRSASRVPEINHCTRRCGSTDGRRYVRRAALRSITAVALNALKPRRPGCAKWHRIARLRWREEGHGTGVSTCIGPRQDLGGAATLAVVRCVPPMPASHSVLCAVM